MDTDFMNLVGAVPSAASARPPASEYPLGGLSGLCSDVACRVAIKRSHRITHKKQRGAPRRYVLGGTGE